MAAVASNPSVEEVLLLRSQLTLAPCSMCKFFCPYSKCYFFCSCHCFGRSHTTRAFRCVSDNGLDDIKADPDVKDADLQVFPTLGKALNN
ncbi:hypothetical protein PC123_g24955 [Phytophthora cactorum]|nr:hypothetical protein PC120_g25091 [Phytophthora cactorum]KAG4039496.1 hypothetical protein PC123_g24955 [Phytophthora cactorum]